MKQLLFTLLLSLPFSGSAQSMFFDLCKTTTWVSEFDSTAFSSVETIGLSKNYWATDSLPKGKKKWTFTENNLLVISSYNSSAKTDLIVGSYKYEFDKEHTVIRIWMKDNTFNTYKVGITSIGNYAVLMKQKRKNKLDLEGL